MDSVSLENHSPNSSFKRPIESLADLLDKIPADEDERLAIVAKLQASLKLLPSINTPLSNFALYPELLSLAISKGANPAATDSENRNAFFYFPNVEAIKLFAKHTNVDTAIRQTDINGLSAPQFLATRDNNDSDEALEAVKAFIRLGAPYKDILDSGSNILHKLAHCNSVKQMELFVHEGCNVNAKNSSGLTPLNIATVMGNYPQIVKLLELGAKAYGDVVIEWIEMLHNFSNEPHKDHAKNQKKLAYHIFRQTNLTDLRWSKLHFAVFTGNLDWIEEAYDKNLDVPLACPCNFHEIGKEYTPLELALDCEASFFLLLEMGARPDLKMKKYIEESSQYALQKELIALFQQNLPKKERHNKVLELIKNASKIRPDFVSDYQRLRLNNLNKLRDLINKLSMRL